ncbi:Leucine-rich repeat-containing protein 71, partial [Durusdinium trenchii]
AARIAELPHAEHVRDLALPRLPPPGRRRSSGAGGDAAGEPEPHVDEPLQQPHRGDRCT